MDEKLIFISSFLIFLGILLLIIGVILNKKVKTEFGFFGLIGPIPIGFWSSKTALLLTLVFLFVSILIILMIRW